MDERVESKTSESATSDLSILWLSSSDCWFHIYFKRKCYNVSLPNNLLNFLIWIKMSFFFKSRIAQPLCLGGLVSYFSHEKSEITINHAYYYAAGIVFCAFYSTITLQPFIFWALKVGIKMRIGCMALIYDKVSIFYCINCCQDLC